MGSEEAGAVTEIAGELVDLSKKFWDGWGFGKLRLRTGSTVKITGPLEGYHVGDEICASGGYCTTKYGEEFRAEVIQADTPVSFSGITRWLAENLPQIGKVRSEQLARAFGPDLWNILETEPERILKIEGINEARLKEIVAAWEKNKGHRELMVEYYDQGLNTVEAAEAKARHIFPHDIQSDPFVLTLLLDVPYDRSQLIWDKVGGGEFISSKVIGAVLETLKAAAGEGSTIMSVEACKEDARALSRTFPLEFEAGYALGVRENYYVEVGDDVMLEKFSIAESLIARKISELEEEDARARRDAEQSAPDDDSF